VSTLHSIRQEIERLTERRAQLFHSLSAGHDPELRAEHEEIEKRIAGLWDEHRALRAQVRFGDRDEIIRRARHEERLERAA
jgi:ABC-type phosphate transport system auxiliary subunit